MPTATYYFQGSCKWAKVHKPDPKYGNYEVNLYMTPESWDLFDQSGLRLERRNDDDGEYVTFRRPHTKLIKGEQNVFGPPEVLLDGEVTDKFIGNGSDVTLKVSVYDTMKGKGHRLEKVRIDRLEEYDEPEIHDELIDSPF